MTEEKKCDHSVSRSEGNRYCATCGAEITRLTAELAEARKEREAIRASRLEECEELRSDLSAAQATIARCFARLNEDFGSPLVTAYEDAICEVRQLLGAALAPTEEAKGS